MCSTESDGRSAYVDGQVVLVVGVVEDRDRDASLPCDSRPTCTGSTRPGNSRPLLRWMVSTWTASASDSSRRLRSSSLRSSRGFCDPPSAATLSSPPCPRLSSTEAAVEQSAYVEDVGQEPFACRPSRASAQEGHSQRPARESAEIPLDPEDLRPPRLGEKCNSSQSGIGGSRDLGRRSTRSTR